MYYCLDNVFGSVRYIFHFQVEVALGADVKEEGSESGANGANQKVLPPWMIRQGMNLTKEQRGETSSAAKEDEKSEAKDDKKQDAKDEKTIQVSLQTGSTGLSCEMSPLE